MRKPGGPADARIRVGRLLIGAALLLLIPLGIGLGFGYYVVGVTPGFIFGAIEARLAPARTPADVVAPAGVTVSVWAQDLSAPTSLTFGPDGRLYVAELTGRVVALSGANRTVFAEGLASPLGLAFYESDLYVGRRGGITRVRDSDGDGAADRYDVILEGLPALRHQTDGLAFSAEGQLYIGQGSTSDRGETGTLPLEASILAAERDGGSLRVFASGTRNPYDLAFFPGTGFLFATDNGRDVPASGVPDELNLIVDGGRYGWPGCWGSGRGRDCAGTLPPVAEFEPHGAVGGLAFYTGEMFPEWRNHAFVTLYGSNSGDPDIGRKVQRVELTQDGATGAWRGVVFDFASGLDRPLDVAVGPDGALYVADFGAGIVYRFGKP